ncbi:MAG: hypothetical protein Q7T74_03775 [Candidatus Saccharibacteria bacterium]|nr:hypothetical protein [Candidatus Saccharibacteria bacterium]
MTKLVIMSGDRPGRIVRSDISIQAGDSCREVATDPDIVRGVTRLDLTLNALGQKAADHMTYVERQDALEDLDAHGLVSNNTQSHIRSRVRNFASGVLEVLR